jgi:hypothetical protein
MRTRVELSKKCDEGLMVYDAARNIFAAAEKAHDVAVKERNATKGSCDAAEAVYRATGRNYRLARISYYEARSVFEAAAEAYRLGIDYQYPHDRDNHELVGH